MSALNLTLAMLAATTPSADVSSPAAVPAWVISLNAPSLFARGAELQAERYFADSRWSAAASLGVRSPAAVDYESFQVGMGAELRAWLWRGGPKVTSTRGRIGGLFASVRLDASRTEMWRAETPSVRSIGFQLQPSLRAGYRFIFFERFELTPSVGPGVSVLRISETKSAPLVRPTLAFSVSVGAVL